MIPSGERHSISFILRLCVESTGDCNPSRWRCQVEHVGSGEMVSFLVPTALLEFLAERLPTSASENPDSMGEPIEDAPLDSAARL